MGDSSLYFALNFYLAEPWRCFLATFLPIVMLSLYPHTQTAINETIIETALAIRKVIETI